MSDRIKLENKIKEYIAEETGCKTSRVNKIYDYLYNNHYNFIDMFDDIDDLLELFK